MFYFVLQLTVTKRCCILSMDIEELQQALQTRKLKALEVLQAFQSKVSLALILIYLYKI